MSGLPAAPGPGVKAGLILAVLALVATPGTRGQAGASGSQRSEAAARVSLAGPTSTGAPPSDPLARWQPYVAEASARFGVPVAWIERVMRAESGGFATLGGRPIVSRAGAMGLMQLMPRTWADMRARYALGADPYDPRDNILAGTAYLAAMYARFGYPGLFGAYNAGPARYAEWLAGRGRLPGETRAYLAQVAGGSGPQTARPALPSSRFPSASLPVQPIGRPELFAIDRGDAAAEPSAGPAARHSLFAVVAAGDRPSVSEPPED